MSKLLALRQKLNLTQQELFERSGISIRTIQRIEAGASPKGHTLKALANALAINESDLLDDIETTLADHSQWMKIINLSALPFIIIPPLNIVVPLLIMYFKKQFNPITKQIISIQILWTLLAILLFVIIIVLNDWFVVRSKFTLTIPMTWVLLNCIVILRNAAEIAKNNSLRIRLNFSII